MQYSSVHFQSPSNSEESEYTFGRANMGAGLMLLWLPLWHRSSSCGFHSAEKQKRIEMAVHAGLSVITPESDLYIYIKHYETLSGG